MISILSRHDIRAIVNKEPNQHVCVVISEPDCNVVEDILPLCKEVLHLEFHDVTYGFGGPTTEHIQQVIEWIQDKKDIPILVSCAAGVSRSSAVAYLIECVRLDPEQAALILDKDVHFPNQLIIDHGIELIGDHIWPPMKDFFKRTRDWEEN